MKIATALKTLVPAALLASASVVIAASPVMDGTRDTSFGTTPLSSQKASVIDITLGTLNAAAQSNQSNLGGVVTFAGSTFTYPAPDSDPALVTTGFELAVDLTEIGWDGSSPIRIAGWQVKDGSGNTVSNQVFGGLPADSGNVGAPATVNFNSITGNQFVTVSSVVNTAATVDGTKDASYPAALFVNTLATTLGNSTISTQNNGNGSEICAVYGYRSATRLYLFVSGNLKTQYDKLMLWIDCKAGGQNVVRNDNAGIDFGVINAHAGMTFEGTVAPDYFIDYTGGSGGDHYLNYAQLPDTGAGAGGYCRGDKNVPVGEFRVLAFPAMPTTNGQTPPPNGGSMEAAFNNSNTAGIAGAIVQPNPWTVPPGSNPGSVTTGAEIKIPLAETGWVPGVTSIKLGGFVLGFNWDYLSNQVIGGVPPTQDNYGFPANGVDFSSPLNAGNQFITLTVPANITTVRNIVLDGTRDAGQGYAGPPWVNNTPANSGNPTGFGDNTDATVDLSNGSELDNVFVSFGLDPANANAPTMWIMAGGNIHDNNKLCFFLDTKAGGQQQMLATNPGFGLQKLGADNNGPGLKWDTGFEPDYMVAYSTGLNNGTPAHTVYAATLPTAGGGIGGVAATGTKAGVTPVLSGTYRARNGFGNNTDTTVARANGSELDAVFAQKGISPVDGSDMLYLFVAGNLETTANKLDIFIDAKPGAGQNTLIYDDPADGYTGNPDVDFSALNRMGGPFTPTTGPVQPGLTFDAGFAADYYVTINTQNVNAAGTTADIYGSYARLKGVNDANDVGAGRYLGKTTTGNFGALDGGTLLTNELSLITIDNSNTGGVAGGANAFVTPTSDPATVTKGIEIGIPIADLAPWNGTTGSIKMMMFVNGIAHDFVSNQVLGTYCGNDLGEPRNVNFNTIPGNQYFELVYNAGTERYTNSVTQVPVCTPPPPACVGDLNGDLQVNVSDLTIFLGQFGKTCAQVAPAQCADFNNDLVVNVNDLTTFLGRFGQTCAP